MTTNQLEKANSLQKKITEGNEHLNEIFNYGLQFNESVQFVRRLLTEAEYDAAKTIFFNACDGYVKKLQVEFDAL
jgi:hypothetical protein